MRTTASNNSRYTGTHADFAKEREQAAKAACRQVQHNTANYYCSFLNRLQIILVIMPNNKG